MITPPAIMAAPARFTCACGGRGGERRKMTPLGERLRALRAERGVSQKDMAAAIGVSAAYLSALEHGRRGAPSWTLIQKIIGYFNVIWDEAEELERLAEASHPRVKLDTSGLSPAATELANLLAENIGRLDEADIERISAMVRAALKG
jgi:transcriptional regulator with XRE-family HTH domain